MPARQLFLPDFLASADFLLVSDLSGLSTLAPRLRLTSRDHCDRAPAAGGAIKASSRFPARARAGGGGCHAIRLCTVRRAGTFNRLGETG